MSRRVGLVVAVTLLAGLALGEIPQVISYQGKVTDASGMPVADGTYTMWFRIYDAVTSGTLLWDSGAQSVALAGGVFSVLLGESPMPALSLDFSQDYWLGVVFSGTSQTPRQRLASVGYSYMASGLVPGTLVSGSVVSGTISAIKAQNTATSGVNYGIFGESASPTGRGVVGEATATSGFSYGVEGGSYSSVGAGVSGWASATIGDTYGVQGWSGSSTGTGVYGWASRSTGVTTGLSGKVESPDGRAVFGEATATYGQNFGGRFQTASTYGYGVLGWASSSTGTTFGGRFETPSTSGRAVWGWSVAGSGTCYGVYGQAGSTSGYGVYYSGGLAGTGTKSCVVRTSRGPTLLYCQESSENWFEDFGRGQLTKGRAHVEVDPLFLETVTIDDANPMMVFVQLHDEACHGAAVKKGVTGFDVIELEQGVSNGTFDYRVVAKRQGFEEKRLDTCEAARSDCYLYPEMRPKSMGEEQNSE